MTDIDIAKLAHLLQSVNTGYSQYEFDNFIIETCPTPARQLIMVMEKILEIQASLNQSDSIGVDIGYYDKDKAQLEKLMKWYNDVKNPENVLAKFEEEESEYWAHTLGRRAAIEILSIGKTSFTTLDQMSQLPTEDFVEAVRVCTKFASLITNITEQTENEINTPINGVIKT